VPHPQACDGVATSTSPPIISERSSPLTTPIWPTAHIDAAIWTVASLHSGEPSVYLRQSDKVPRREKPLALTLPDVKQFATVPTFSSIWRTPPTRTEWLGALLRGGAEKF
jgi:hypothetical protein